MNSLAVAIARMFSVESLLACLLFSVSFYGILFLCLIVSNNYTVAMWVIAIPLALTFILALQEYCRDLISHTGTFSSENVVLSANHFKPSRGDSSFFIQIFLFVGSYKLLILILGTVVPHPLIGLLFIFFMPASYAYVSITDDALGSLNPINLIYFSRKLGVDYLLIWLVIGIAYLAATQALGHYRNPSFLFTFASVFLLLLCANHIGATIAANHRDLGIVDPEEEKQEKFERKARRQFETQIY